MGLLEGVKLDKILFLDIETVSQRAEYEALDGETKKVWQQKGNRFARQDGKEWDEEVASRTYHDKAAIFAEFGRIIVISVGILYHSGEGMGIRVKSFADSDEKQLLTDFSSLLGTHFNRPGLHSMCGHNVREFDIPYIARRMVIHGMPIPTLMDLSRKKPWETKHILDTMEMWRFGDYKNYTTLALLAHVLGIPTPKDDIDGSQVGDVYWKERDLDRIAAYCEKDVATCAQIVLRLLREPPIPADRILTAARHDG